MWLLVLLKGGSGSLVLLGLLEDRRLHRLLLLSSVLLVSGTYRREGRQIVVSRSEMGLDAPLVEFLSATATFN